MSDFPDDYTRPFGYPGSEPRWTVSAKDGVGTAYAASSRVWFTLSLGILSEIYYPRLDRPQTRDLQLMVTDGETFVHEAKRDLKHTVSRIDENALGYRVVSEDPKGRYRLEKTIITDPHQATVLMQTKLLGDDAAFLSKLKVFALLAPHLQVGGWGNNARVTDVAGKTVVVAWKGNTHLAWGATVPIPNASCGYVGKSDGWTDLHDNKILDWTFPAADDGNLALTIELDLAETKTFTMGLSFGDTRHSAVTALMQGLDVPFRHHEERFKRQWARACAKRPELDEVSHDDGRLYRASHALLLSHEDKTYQGATIASLSIPWGHIKSDQDIGGYHLVWPRDMYHSVSGLMAAGNTETPLRALVYLACAQQEDGGFPQNFWLDGTPYWTGIQLDSVAFPVILAWDLKDHDALRGFDPYPMVLRAARFLIVNGPVTPQERWEENSGYSPSTLAAEIAALVCAADFARERHDDAIADFLLVYADFLEAHIEEWTVTDQGVILDDVKRHYVRINPIDLDDPHNDEDPDTSILPIRNRGPHQQFAFPANEIVDAGFLELVRFGIRPPGDPLIEDSLKVVDAVLKVETPHGPVWRRYNHDGYGQRDDGGPFKDWGVGRGWPLLTGERGHYEHAAGRDATLYVQTLENFATEAGLMPEQVWDAPDLPERHQFLGEPIGAAMPLMWAHAEYIKLLRSIHDGETYDRPSVVADRYLSGNDYDPPEVWTFQRQVRSIPKGCRLRVLVGAPFRLRWWPGADTGDPPGGRGGAHMEEAHGIDVDARDNTLDLYFADVDLCDVDADRVQFTFFWPDADRWEGRTYEIKLRA